MEGGAGNKRGRKIGLKKECRKEKMREDGNKGTGEKGEISVFCSTLFDVNCVRS